ncbi:lipase family protein [Terriglobus sp. 2YAB30_2]|uniref:lipase family protein n=2 Tax=unclassified Terriglobus TaxID=2628988 RepID=UPI003F9701C5
MSTTAYAPSSLSSKGKATCQVSTNPPALPQSVPAGFDAQLAYVLGLCCNAANDQYSDYVTNTPADPKNLLGPKSWQIQSVAPTPWDPDFSQIVAQGYTLKSHTNLSVYETDINGNSVQIPAGFIAQLEPTGTKKSSIIVVAFHGTQNSYEGGKIDIDVIPATFGGLLGNLGSVHGGFYKQYTTGSNGQGNLIDRVDGSLAQQIYQYFKENEDPTISVKVTGHSLGGALATLCALDIAFNFESKFDAISMYSLASPRVADSWASDPSGVSTLVSNYQEYVPDSYRIVNTLDSVPGRPSALTPPWPPVQNYCAHVFADDVAIQLGIVNPSALYKNLISFSDANSQNGTDSPPECQGAHSCPAVYVPFLKRLAAQFA